MSPPVMNQQLPSYEDTLKTTMKTVRITKRIITQSFPQIKLVIN